MDATKIIRSLNKQAGYRRYRTRWIRSGQLAGAHVVEAINGAGKFEFIRHVDELPQLAKEIAAELRR